MPGPRNSITSVVRLPTPWFDAHRPQTCERRHRQLNASSFNSHPLQTSTFTLCFETEHLKSHASISQLNLLACARQQNLCWCNHVPIFAPRFSAFGVFPPCVKIAHVANGFKSFEFLFCLLIRAWCVRRQGKPHSLIVFISRRLANCVNVLCLSACVYACMRACACVQTCRYGSMYADMCVCVRLVCMHVCMSVRLVCMHACMHACM